jgi:phage-related tail fiber protein
MARTNLTRHQFYNGRLHLTKLNEHDTALDALETTVNGVIDFKQSCRLATTANHGLSGVAAIDGVVPVAGDRILVKSQVAPEANGIYVAAAGAWSRATDANVSAEVTSGLLVHVSLGTANADTWWTLTTNDPITLGTTGLVFTQMPNYADLASTSASKGASLVGIQDASGLVTGTTVETAITGDIAKGNGLSAMAPVRRVRAVTAANLASFAGVAELLDGVTLVEGDRVLVAAQSAPAENGIYVVGTVAAGVADWTRAADMAAAAVIPNGTIIVVDAGTAGANRIYKITNAGAITIATTGLTFARIPSVSDRINGTFVAATANANVIGGVPVVHRIAVPDGTGNTDVVLTHQTLITHIEFLKTTGAGGAADTCTVQNAANAITNAMDTNVADLTIVRPTTMDDAQTTIAAGGTLRVAINDGGAGASSAGLVIVQGLRID